MPLPVSHSLAGGAVYAGLDRDGGSLVWRRLLLALVLANAPDLDMIPGILIGDPNRFHHGVSHSLGAAVLAGALASLLVVLGAKIWPLIRGLRLGGAASTGLMVGSLWTSHVLLDLVTADGSAPYGVPLFWPLSDRYFLPFAWFPHVQKAEGPMGVWAFAASLMDPHNLWAATVETATLLPVVILLVWWRHRR